MGDPFRSNQGSNDSVYIGLSYASYPARMCGHLPGIDVKRWWEDNITKCCRSQQHMMRSDCTRGQKVVYMKGFHIRITQLACEDAFPRSRRKCCWNAKITNFVVRDNGKSILVGLGVERNHIWSASICRINYMHTFSRSDDIPQTVSIPPATIYPTTPSIPLQIGRVGAWNEAILEWILSEYEREQSTPNSSGNAKMPVQKRDNETVHSHKNGALYIFQSSKSHFVWVETCIR
jgi:hypothetical protein